MPATHPLESRPGSLNDRIAQQREHGQRLWLDFERERQVLASAALDDEAAVRRAEAVHSKYETSAAELRDREAQRERTRRMLPGNGRQTLAGRREPGELPEPGEWLHGEIQRLGEFYALSSGAGLGSTSSPVSASGVPGG